MNKIKNIINKVTLFIKNEFNEKQLKIESLERENEKLKIENKSLFDQLQIAVEMLNVSNINNDTIRKT